ncbi:MAG: hypothetical protein M9954_12430 [Cyclobacteriaceae bacterium]|nr:hypothetical protein [Cyclobacteriaceae bacterium]MCB0500837.1 hypothetical protein [Cyclobacteriaceae bacterium]MCB9239216.1 hypothetical protein [Flammeovirgaceae bacterium]MCO5272458.1 hypothetical protein [Cyclobacteriaceae bacterium]MCW5903351.1 hypothetical protein [Cyclobacteriaceae bacterium]
MDVLTKKLNDIQAFMKYTYGIIPIVAGVDKFTNLLTEWVAYLNPGIAQWLPFGSHLFMQLVGVMEIGAGIMVLVNPKRAAYVVCGWLVLIAISLMESGHYLDVALRDLVIAAGAYLLGKLSAMPGIKRARL